MKLRIDEKLLDYALGREETERTRGPKRDEFRFSEMLAMRESGMSLQEIGDHYHISRERIRQIIGTRHKEKYRNTKFERIVKIVESNPGKSAADIGTIVGCKHGAVYSAMKKAGLPIRFLTEEEESNRAQGMRIENIVSEKLKRMGIENTQMGTLHPFDILLSDGKRVDVKSSATPIKPPSSRYGYYVFDTRQKKKGSYCDFFILVVHETMDMYIIPAPQAPAGQIRIASPRKKKSKFDKFLNNYDLMKTPS